VHCGVQKILSWKRTATSHFCFAHQLGQFGGLAAGGRSAARMPSSREVSRQQSVPPRRGGNRATHGHPALGCYVSMNNVEPTRLLTLTVSNGEQSFFLKSVSPRLKRQSKHRAKGARQHNWPTLRSECLLKICGRMQVENSAGGNAEATA